MLSIWSEEADAKLKDCFASTDWNMFWDSSNDIEEYTTSVTGAVMTSSQSDCTYISQPEAMDYRQHPH